MDNPYLTQRNLEIDDTMNIKSCMIQFQALNDIITHAEYSKTEIGWGLLLGYFEPQTHLLRIKKTWQCEHKNQQQNIDQSQRELLLESLDSFEDRNYRQVGFYIFSNDLENFSSNLVNFLINNPEMQAPNVFMHFNLLEANQGQPCVHLYKLSQEFNQICKGHRQDANVYYQLEEEKVKQFIQQNEDIFQEVDFEFENDNLKEFLNTALQIDSQIPVDNTQTDNEQLLDQFGNVLNDFLILKNNQKAKNTLQAEKELEQYGNKRKLLNFLEMNI